MSASKNNNHRGTIPTTDRLREILEKLENQKIGLDVTILGLKTIDSVDGNHFRSTLNSYFKEIKPKLNLIGERLELLLLQVEESEEEEESQA